MGLTDLIFGSRTLSGNPNIQPNTIKTQDVYRTIDRDVFESHYENITEDIYVSFPVGYSVPNPVFISGDIPKSDYFKGVSGVKQTNLPTSGGGC